MPHTPRPPIRYRSVLFTTVCLALFVYLGYHAIVGQYGLKASAVLDHQVSQLQGEHAELAAKRAKLEAKIGLLRPESLDPDMLDRQARALLNFAHENDLVIGLDPARKGR